MSGKYTAKAANAAKAIAKAGALLPFRRFAKVFDAVTGGTTNGTILAQSLPALVLPVGKDDSLPEGLVVANARKLLVAGYGATFQLKPNDVTKFSGLYWEIKGVEPLQPDAQDAILFTAFVEKANLSTEDETAFA